MNLTIDAAASFQQDAKAIAQQLNLFNNVAILTPNLISNAAQGLNIEIDEDDVFI